jgi:hypothetical protein
MKRIVEISQDEKKSILEKYSIIKEDQLPLEECSLFDLKKIRDSYEGGNPLSIDINALSDKELMVIKSSSLGDKKMCLAKKADIMKHLN